MNRSDGYKLLAGKCLVICEAIAQACPEFSLVRGHYHCPIWNKDRAHWWLTCDGVIYDPTVWQFPSAGAGEYVPFSGIIDCAECGKQVPEEEAVISGNYGCCSGECVWLGCKCNNGVQ